MSKPSPRGDYSCGFSLIEVIIIMVLIIVGMLGMNSMFGTTMASLNTNEDLQRATQLAQECAERVLAQRRNNGFDSFGTATFTCNPGGANPAGYTRTANPVGATYTGDGTPCPNTMTCRDVSITVTSTSNPSLSSTVDLMLVYY
ncbi:MAG: prepilin-type N-terminal cleavage/methylation domain-containing protein [Rhodocyclaceae bacterium]|nr:prepilin-type N-terminal cleavage/methylation domain-containing protein [Rhodocyclaceae bacterium]